MRGGDRPRRATSNKASPSGRERRDPAPRTKASLMHGNPAVIEPLYGSNTPDSRSNSTEKESACKPGSVEDSHSSGIAVTGDLKRPTRKHAGTPAATCVATSLFGLAPGGVCRAADVATGAVRSYRTVSPLPASLLTLGGLLSVALSVGSRRPGVTWHLVRRSPDFPPHFARNAATVRPTPARTIATWLHAHKLLVSRAAFRRCFGPFESSSARA